MPHERSPAGGLLSVSILAHIEREEHATRRDPHNTNWCRTKKVGRLRRRLGPVLPPNVSLLAARDTEAVRNDTAKFWAGHCKACSLCVLGKKEQD